MAKPSGTTDSDRTIPRLVLAGTSVILLTLGAGWLLDKNIVRLIQARSAYEHSLQLQATLQATVLRLERIDSVGHLYLMNRLWSSLRDTQTLSVTLESNARQVADLVTDNPEQAAAAQSLIACTHQLADSLRSLDAPNAAFPSALQLGCREVAVLMLQHENSLLQKRNRESEDSTVSLTFVGVLLAGFSILIAIVLFGALIRDAILRRLAQQETIRTNEQLAATIQVLEDRASEMRLLGNARDQLQMCVTASEVYETCIHFISQLLPASSGALYLVDNSHQNIEAQSAWGTLTASPDVFPVESCCGMRSGQVCWRTPDTAALHCEHFSRTPPDRYVCLPLVAHSETLGMVYIECADAEAARIVEQRLAPLRSLLQLASMTVSGVNLRNRLESQSIRDSLTGLFNRHFMEITLQREIRRADRKKSLLAVLMLDADHFKQFNDTFGHTAGDMVLKAIAERFVASVRSEDIVCRYGGEEFVIILPDISSEHAAERAQQIRGAIDSLRVTERGQMLGPVTVSIGAALYPRDGRSIEGLLQAADRSLYIAKKNGRNRVVFAAQGAGTPIIAK
jgi:diguanylate cyclase (GGDEF)-like protein